jgi:nucleoside-diphosphate-sugar epimerase
LGHFSGLSLARDARIVVFGGSGFVGNRLVRDLVARGARVTIADLQQSKEHARLWRFCDVRDLASVVDAAAGADAIVNLAAVHRDDVRPLSRYHETNVNGARNVCAAARELGIRRILFTSSVAVYGFQPGAATEACGFAPFNEYGRTKLEAEQVYEAWAAEDPLRSLVIVRPTVIFGEGNRGNVYNLLRQIASGRFWMVGNGTNVKSIAYVGNVSRFLVHALSSKPGVHVFNYSDGPDMTTRELIDFVRQCLGHSSRLPSLPMPLALAIGSACDAAARLSGRTFPVSAIRIRKFCANTIIDAEKAMSTGFRPTCSLKEGLARTIRHEFLPQLAKTEAVLEVDSIDRRGAA